jgi:hypothetical protein
LLGPISGTAKQSGLQDISRCEYWDLSRDGAVRADVTLSWSENSLGKSLCNILSTNTNLNQLQVVPYHNYSWGDKLSTYFGNTEIRQDPSIIGLSFIRWNGDKNANNIDSYEKFVIGTTSITEAPLLFELKDFIIHSDIRGVDISWRANQNNLIKEFAIEKSNDGLQFKIMHTFLSKKNEKTAQYSFLDTDVLNGWIYYRIRITDFAGNIQYSDIHKIRIDNKIRKIAIFPQPASNQIQIDLANNEKINEIIIMSSMGQLMFKKTRPDKTAPIDISNLQPGIYYIRMIGQLGTYTTHFVKE